MTTRKGGGCCCGAKGGLCGDGVASELTRTSSTIGIDWRPMTDGYYEAPPSEYSAFDGDCITTGPANFVAGAATAQHGRVTVPTGSPSDGDPCDSWVNVLGVSDVTFTLSLSSRTRSAGDGLNWHEYLFDLDSMTVGTVSCPDEPTFEYDGHMWCGSFNGSSPSAGAGLPSWESLERDIVLASNEVGFAMRLWPFAEESNWSADPGAEDPRCVEVTANGTGLRGLEVYWRAAIDGTGALGTFEPRAIRAPYIIPPASWTNSPIGTWWGNAGTVGVVEWHNGFARPALLGALTGATDFTLS